MEAHQLELVNDYFEEGVHERLDEQLRGLSELLTPENMDFYGPAILIHITRQSNGRISKKYFNILECKSIVEKQPDLRNGLLAGSKTGYRCIRLASKESIESSDHGSNIPS